jgi:parvulin-like peptidyl-prolyl isomerase
MTTLDTTIASLPGTRLSLGGLLNRLRAQGRLGPLVREALAEQLVQEQARQAGLSVTADELQAAADAFRRAGGLYAAADTHARLAEQGLSVDDLEQGLEEALLAAKLKQHLAAAGVDDYFSAHRAGLEVLQLVQVRVERDELARELVSQVRDEGRGLEEVAREHGLPVARCRLFRKDLGGPLAGALASAGAGELVGPVGTPEGFALVAVEECRPADLDPATRRRIEDELFGDWLAGRMREVTFDLATLRAPR